MNKTAIKNFSIWARNKLIDDIRYHAGLLGINEDGIQFPLPQSTKDTEFYDIGMAEPYSISGEAVKQRSKLVEAIRKKERNSDYQTAYKYIVEEVAYTWFNRLIAIRFMEVNDYLPLHIRVLSSESGKLEPDLVTTPFDAELSFTADEKQTVMQLKRDNHIDELFRLLFIKQCNALNKILPGLFEKTSDYTEILFSVSVVDQEGVVYRLTHDIDEDDFNIEKGGQIEIIGWLYQYWNTEPKDAVFSRPSGAKIKKEEIPAATQLFTPDWIVRYMVENSLGRLWVEGHPNDDLKLHWKYYLEEAEQEPAVQAQLAEIRKEYASLAPEDIKCIDPCMGSGHILCYLFDVLIQIYESCGYSQRDAAQSIVRHNLYGLDIDKRAAQLAYFSVMMKARQYDRRFFSRSLQPMVYSTTGDEEGENFGSLVMVDDPGEMPRDPETVFEWADYENRLNAWSYRYLLSQKYHVVVTNPPYMGNMPKALASYAEKKYYLYRYDAYALFIAKSIELVSNYGYIAMVTGDSWLTLSSFISMRRDVFLSKSIITLLELGNSAFESGFGTTTFVLNALPDKYIGKFYNCANISRNGENVQQHIHTVNAFKHCVRNFLSAPNSAVIFTASQKELSLFANNNCHSILTPKAGIVVGNNDLYMRLWHEVEREKILLTAKKEDAVAFDQWIPIHKGGGYRKYYGIHEYVLHLTQMLHDRKNNKSIRTGDKKFYFKSGITWSTLSNKFAVRESPSGFVYNTKGSMCFTKTKFDLSLMIGYLNSVVAKRLISILAPNLDYNSGTIVELPYISPSQREAETVIHLSDCAVKLSKIDWDSFETSWDFQYHPIVRKAFSRFHWNGSENISLEYVYEFVVRDFEVRFNQLKANEEELNRIFIDIYGLQDELTPEVEDKDVTVRRADLGRDIRSLLSYAVGCMFGRYSLDVEGLAYAGGKWDSSKYTTFIPDADGIIPITDEEYLDDDIVSLLCKWLKEVFGSDSLEENLNFIAKALGCKGNTSREIIRNYFMKDFFADHCKIYQKRPIYWLFDSGKQNGFKTLIYLHRYTPDTIGNVRIDYLHRMQRIYENEIERMQDMIDNSKNPREVAASTKRKEKLQKQLKECREYDEKISHLALSRIELDLDDGVKVNYRKLQTASDGKFYEVLADSKNIIGKK